MTTRTNWSRLAAVAALLVMPLLASATGDLCYLRDASAPTPSTAYLLCEQGLIYSTRDAGANWTLLRTGATETLHALTFTDEMHGIAVGDAGTILGTQDGGKSWQKRIGAGDNPITSQNLLDVFSIGNEMWIGGYEGTILHSADAGRSWQTQESGTTMAVQGIYFMDRDHGWGVGWSGSILLTNNGGQTWQPVKSNAATWSLNSVYFRDARNGWAVGFAGELLRSRDGGVTWEAQKSPVMSSLSSPAIDNKGRIWIAADEQLLVSDDGGEKWTVAKVDNNLFLTKLFGAGDNLWAMGELGILKQASTGADWKRVESFIPAGTYIPDSLEAAPGVPSADK